MARLIAALALTLGLVAAASPERATSKSPERCPVTVPGRVPPQTGSDIDAADVNYGNSKLRAHIWPRGVLLAGPLPDGAVSATIEADGTIRAKLGWWRGVPGKLVITGRRLDARAPKLRAHVPYGYGRVGFQATALMFPTVGCWRVVGTVGAARLAFVVKVRKR